MTTTPAPRDERELFLSRFGKLYDLVYDEEIEAYEDPGDQSLWYGWQARAALAESELAEVRDQNTKLRARISGRNIKLVNIRLERDELRAELERVKEIPCKSCESRNVNQLAIEERQG